MVGESGREGRITCTKRGIKRSILNATYKVTCVAQRTRCSLDQSLLLTYQKIGAHDCVNSIMAKFNKGQSKRSLAASQPSAAAASTDPRLFPAES